MTANENQQYLLELRKRLPTIGLLSEIDDSDIGACFETVLVKPFTREQLALALAAVLKSVTESATLIRNDELLARIGGNKQLLRQMSDLLAKQAETWRVQISTAVEQSDSAALQRTAHQAKGALANFAAPLAASAAQDLEEIARAGRWEQASETVSRLDLLIRQLVQELAAM
ncbi:MAG TPA: Hpt domain-containing protein [Gemmataceae bacterium]|nr:Hpt domain-containing protein [Gemmataceae bacterium]